MLRAPHSILAFISLLVVITFQLNSMAASSNQSKVFSRCNRSGCNQSAISTTTNIGDLSRMVDVSPTRLYESGYSDMNLCESHVSEYQSLFQLEANCGFKADVDSTTGHIDFVSTKKLHNKIHEKTLSIVETVTGSGKFKVVCATYRGMVSTI